MLPYLTYAEYQDMGFEVLEETEFKRLLKRASAVLNSRTKSFYLSNDLETDFPWRRDAFKMALAHQIEYFHDMGATSTHGLNEPQSVQIGRTSMSTGSRGSTTQQPQNSLISKDALMYLSDTGLLYSGLGVAH